MADLKTKPSDQSVRKFLDGVADQKRRQECFAVLELMKQVTKQEPKMWGSSMVGFGSYHYKYASGREGDWFLTGFSPRKRDLTIYLMCGFSEHKALMQQLGRFKTGVSCLYVKSIQDIDLRVLKKLVKASVDQLRKQARSSG